MITHRELKKLQTLCKNRKEKVPSDTFLSSLCNELNIGITQGKYIHINPAEYLTLRRHADTLAGGDIFAPITKAENRMDASRTSHDEKSTAQGVFEALLTMARADNLPLPIKDTQLTTPKGSLFSATLDIIDTNKIESIVIIENGSLLTHWHEMVPFLPPKYQSALFIYRGHGKNQAMLNTLLKSLPKTTYVGLFYDFDAAGLAMMQSVLTVRQADIIVPSEWQSIHQHPNIQGINKPDAYIKQIDILERLENLPIKALAHPIFSQLIAYLRAHRLAVTQEHLITYAFALSTENLHEEN